MNMFAKTSGGLRNQTTTLHQIAQRSEQPGKAFDKYSPGKELQLPLLAVSHQQPELFLGIDPFLKNLLRGVKKKNQTQIPIISSLPW